MSTGLAAFTLFHVILSLAGILAGFVVVLGFLSDKRLDGWTAVFICTTALTSLTGYLFPFHKVLPSHILGALSLIALAIAIYARYQKHLDGGWRKSYVVSSVVALYFNVFVLIAQLYMKVPALKAIAPTQTEAPFKITQLTALVFFVVLGVLCTVRFRDERLRTA